MIAIQDPTHMQAAILVAQQQPLVVDRVELPRQLYPHQVLVQVHYSSICGSQLGEIDGVKGPDPYLPHLLGHEGSGTVLQVGSNVTNIAPGDRVVMHWRKGAGVQGETAAYRWRDEPLRAGHVTTFSQYAIVSENRLTPIPMDFDASLAVLLGCAVTTGLGIVNNDCRLAAGESIVVLGAGGVGLAVVQAAALADAATIVAVDRFENRLDLARRLGATHCINTDHEDLGDRSRSIVGTEGPDVIIENTGNTRLIELAYEMAAPQGRVVLVGVPPFDQTVRLHTLPLHFGKRLTGSHGGSAQPQEDIPRCIRLAAEGRLQLAAMLTNRYPLADINTAIADMRRGHVAGRCLLEINPI